MGKHGLARHVAVIRSVYVAVANVSALCMCLWHMAVGLGVVVGGSGSGGGALVRVPGRCWLVLDSTCK